ncbi:MAG: prepilin-type N-terminal cleavage/methylation domain-containing protein [Candidatus Gastranaerophilales bacterium]|nr:prepilin-type N-terminal cleavage/methylation domain-containing protein [Candidatus Gastranaerophilales bacterium]
MNFKKAFTLSEVMIVMVIMIILILITLKVLKPDAYKEKAYIAQGQKIISVLDGAFFQIMHSEKKQCPLSKYMAKPIGGNWEFTIMEPDGVSLANSEALVNLFAKHIKYEIDNLDFCDYSSICSSDAIKGAKLAGGTYIGFNIYEDIEDCPSYRLPGVPEEISAPSEYVDNVQQTKKCWGEIYIDLDGKKGADVIGQDAFILGLGEYGIEK